MLQMRGMRVHRSAPENLAPGASINEEGVALAFIKVGGETFVAPSTGAAGEVFAGLPIMRNIPPSLIPMVETATVKADGKFALTKAPKGAQFLVKNGASPLAPAATAAEVDGDATKVFISGAAGAVDVSLAGARLTVQYLWEPTVDEARLVIGDAPYGGIAANLMGTVGVLKQVQNVGTSFFDAASDWSGVLHAKLGAGGRFVPAKASEGIPGLIVKNSPTADSPFLQLDFNIA